MATKQKRGIVICAPDGKLYFVSPDDPMAPSRIDTDLTPECKEALKYLLEKCLKITSDAVVLSGVVTRADGIALSAKRKAQRSAKRRP